MDFNPSKYLILGYEGEIPEDNFLNFISNYPPAGIILLAYNYKNVAQLQKSLQLVVAAAGKKILIGVDQEPGRVQRFKSGFPISLMPDSYLQKDNFDDFTSWCKETSSMLKECGVNLCFAPVVDVNIAANSNKVLVDRAFGKDPRIAGSFAGILIREFMKNKILTCAKHFPGLGGSLNDPHDLLSVSNERYETFNDSHWVPFRTAVEDGVHFIMTTHLLARALDNTPATYSEKIVDILRANIRFDKAVISDDLLMGGAGDEQRFEQSCLASLAAGHNLLIISKNLALQNRAVDIIKKRYETDMKFRERLKKSDALIEKAISEI